MSLKRVIYVDSDGRKKIVLLPEGIPEEEADKGVPVGPASLEELGLPVDIEIRLHNELFNRGIITAKDALRGRNEIFAALQTVLKVDIGRIVTLYVGKDYRNARKESPENIPDAPVPYRRPRKSR